MTVAPEVSEVPAVQGDLCILFTTMLQFLVRHVYLQFPFFVLVFLN